MINAHTNEQPPNRVTVKFADGSRSFLSPRDATLGHIADRVDNLSARLERPVIAVAVRLAATPPQGSAPRLPATFSRRFAGRTSSTSRVCQLHGTSTRPGGGRSGRRLRRRHDQEPSLPRKAKPAPQVGGAGNAGFPGERRPRWPHRQAGKKRPPCFSGCYGTIGVTAPGLPKVALLDMAIELARALAHPRPWGVVDLRPWSNAGREGVRIGEIWYERPGERSPSTSLLVKLLFTSEALSIQVHPDDGYAGSFGLRNGKTEAWYVLSATARAKVALGLKRPLTAVPADQRSEGTERNRVRFRGKTTHAGDDPC